jgi:hypothetical protein
MRAIYAPKCETLALASKCFVVNGDDFFADFLGTLIDPPLGISNELAADVWLWISEDHPEIQNRQIAIAQAFVQYESPQELARVWRELIGG